MATSCYLQESLEIVFVCLFVFSQVGSYVQSLKNKMKVILLRREK